MQKRILIVDDEPSFLEFMKEYFTKTGGAVDTAHDGLEAARQLDCADYDYVLFDYNMPGLSGVELVTVIQEKNPRAQRIMITGYDAIDENLMKRLGAHRFFTKPVSLETLGDILKE
ncbi:MAG: hypothetical protein A3D28_01840 [Omnitrophica bacterium RIFCSPHIGHO2_02_FULL_63_14]|nr:MAG: hypothetical protein A3D28_01840 [Omnitrophica bacterium RIFCSPHIGHO2_02_FULL_63_14]